MGGLLRRIPRRVPKHLSYCGACRGFLQHGGELIGIGGRRLAGSLDADERLSLRGAEIWESLIQSSRKRICRETLGCNAKNGFSEAVDAGGGFLETPRLRVFRAAGDDNLQRVA